MQVSSWGQGHYSRIATDATAGQLVKEHQQNNSSGNNCRTAVGGTFQPGAVGDWDGTGEENTIVVSAKVV